MDRYADIIKTHSARNQIKSTNDDSMLNSSRQNLLNGRDDDCERQSNRTEHDHYDGEVKRNNLVTLLVDEYQAD